MRKVSCLLFLCVAMSCSDAASTDMPEWRWTDPEPTEKKFEEPNPDLVSAGWTNVTTEEGTMPEGIAAYRSPESLQGVKVVAYVAVADLTKAVWDVHSIDDPRLQGTDDPLRTPSEWYAEKPAPVIVNGGFFYAEGGKRYSASAAVSGGRTFGVNVNYASQDWVTIYYPTRGVFYEKDGAPKTGWTYYVNDNSHYLYGEPAANSWSSEPLQQPGPSFPVKAEAFSARTAVGGGPVLIRDGEIRNTFREELFDGTGGILCDSRQPRTAIGATADNRMMLFVCEGRNMTEGVPGLTSAEVAEVLKALGCTEALNLDGGGSSCLLVNNRETIQPSDGAQRAVASVVVLEAK